MIATKSHGQGTATSKAISNEPQSIDPAEARFQFAKNYLFGPDVTDDRIRAFIRLEPPMPLEQFALVNSAIREFDYRPHLTKCNTPVLVLHGDHDRLIPDEFGKELASVLPNAQFVSVPRAGHAVIAEKPEGVNQAIHKFLKPE
ncbi:alpha/beta fold hydrolase [Effusibacillus lacus]|uniref:Peptidase S33 tripeptidyl aminopeptidase-like C-terminal domain-containing protein n=1 Tax=Effusibacillus lacus TaxID=1348429 RepID=A0A292YFT6_9BACL|nr:alpha/beta hydrolase [Effusibacillus lacus]TCS75084.1 TAP-like protein [Effusibacillus lacus]GAX89037.1 hypothetical protein EFBL_0651 [Effusibacillus lacus]